MNSRVSAACCCASDSNPPASSTRRAASSIQIARRLQGSAIAGQRCKQSLASEVGAQRIQRVLSWDGLWISTAAMAPRRSASENFCA